MEADSSGLYLPSARIYMVNRSDFSPLIFSNSRDLSRDTAAPNLC